MRVTFSSLLVASAIAVGIGALSAHAQLQVPSATTPGSESPTLADPAFSSDTQVLIDADKRFAADVLKGGGAVFVSWFADDAVTLSNQKATVQGKSAITSQATWKPDDYQLTWTPDGARIGPSRDMGVTWGRFEGRSRDHQGNPLVTSGRYITVWRKDKSGQWKVVLDASNDAPPDTGACCSVH
jgi:ketosteroid isomerase-like protein